MRYLLDELSEKLSALEGLSSDYTLIQGSHEPEYLAGASSDDLLIGFTGSDTLHGGGGDDILLGYFLYEDEAYEPSEVFILTQGDQDQLYGGSGNDLYLLDSWVANPAQIVELHDQGIDWILGDFPNYTIPDNVEYYLNDLTLTNDGIPVPVSVIGNSSDNYISTYSFRTKSAEEFHGLDGNDFFFGGSGNDVMYGGNGTDTSVYRYHSSDYEIINGTNGSFTITYIGSNTDSQFEGTDTLYDIEFAEFSDEVISLVDTDELSPGSYKLDVIVDLFGQVLILKNLTEIVTETSHTIEYQGVDYSYADIDSMITTVVRDGDFTAEFENEIADAFPSAAGISYQDAVGLIGIAGIDNAILAVARADGNFVG